MKRYKVLYGSVNPAQIEKLHRTIREIKAALPDLDIEKLCSLPSTDNDDYFGSKIKLSFNPSIPDESELSYLQTLHNKKDGHTLKSDLTLSYDVVEAVTKKAGSQEPDAGISWLENTIQAFYGDELPMGGMSHMEFSVTIMERLSTDIPSEELQAELFDLCGFERFDMVGAILEKRKQLVKAFKVIFSSKNIVDIHQVTLTPCFGL